MRTATDPRIHTRCPRCGDEAIDHRLDRHHLRCRNYAANYRTATASPLPGYVTELVRHYIEATTAVPDPAAADQPSLFGDAAR